MTRRSTCSLKRRASDLSEDLRKKRARTNRSPEQGGETTREGFEPCTGSPASIMSMPVEVFCEIACYSSPEDLLSIARVSRAFRKVLISKSSRSIWAVAERNVGMPPCPPDLSSPQYFSLLFDKFCMRCLTPRAKGVNIEMRARLCKKCEVKEIVSGETLLPKGMEPIDLAAIIPGDELDSITTEDWYETFAPPYSTLMCRTRQLYYKPLITNACQEYLATGKDRNWLIARSKRLLQLKLHAQTAESWLEERKQDRRRDIEDLKKQRRRASILRLLDDLGYTQEDYSPIQDDDDWVWDALISQSRELSEKEWAILRPQLEETIRLRREKTRRECASSRRQVILNIARSMVRSKKVKLLLYDELLEHPVVSNIISADGLHKTISEGDIQAVKASALDLGTKRLQEAADFFEVDMIAAFTECGLLPSTSDCDQDKPSRSSSISSRNIVNHSCAQFKYKNCRYRPPSTFNELVMHHNPEDPEKLYERFSPDTQVILIAKRLAEDLGVLHLSSGELALFKDSFVCARCDPLFRKKMDWQALIRHFWYEKIGFEKVKVEYTGQRTLETFFVNDHCLEDKSLGRGAININSAGGPDEKYFINKCSCTAVHQLRTERCRICAELRALTECLCRRCMDVHYRTKHRSSCDDEDIVAIWNSAF